MSTAEPLLLEQVAGPLLETVMRTLPVLIAVAAMVLGMTYLWRFFKILILDDLYIDEVGPPPAPKPQPVKVTWTKPEALEACGCQACTKGWGHTRAELTPPTLEDWEGWRKYGLITDKGS